MLQPNISVRNPRAVEILHQEWDVASGGMRTGVITKASALAFNPTSLEKSGKSNNRGRRGVVLTITRT